MEEDKGLVSVGGLQLKFAQTAAVRRDRRQRQAQQGKWL